MKPPWLLVTGDFATTGAMDLANYALARYLALRGHETHLVAHRVAEDLLRLPNIVFHRVPKPAGSYLLAAPLLDRMGRFWAARISARGGRVIVNGGGCVWGDVNWVHYVHAAYRRRTAAGALRRAKSWLAHLRARAAERRALSISRVVVANSRRTAADLVEKLGMPESRIHTVYLGVDRERFRPADERERLALRGDLGWDRRAPVIVFVGALGDSRKGFDAVFRAWRALCAEPGWDGGLAVAGAGAELPIWRARAEDAGLGARIRLMGFQKDVASILRACDAVVAPTRYDSYGMAVHEALCCGAPALVSSAAGVAERYPVELRHLLIDDPENAENLAARLRRWRASRGETREAALRLSRELRSYTWENMAERMVGVIEGGPRAGARTERISGVERFEVVRRDHAAGLLK